MAFRLKTRGGVDDLYIHVLGAASTQYTAGALGKMVSGLPAHLAGQTDQPFMLIEQMTTAPYGGQSMSNVNAGGPLRPATALLTTTAGERLIGIPVNPAVQFQTDITPLIGGAAGGAAAQANASKSTVIVNVGSATTGQLTGGVVYLPEQDWQAIITSSPVAANIGTLTIQPPAPRACTTGDTVQIIPFGPGAAPKWASVNPHLGLSNAIADNTGGLFLVTEVAAQYGNPKGSSMAVSGIIKSPI